MRGGLSGRGLGLALVLCAGVAGCGSGDDQKARDEPDLGVTKAPARTAPAKKPAKPAGGLVGDQAAARFDSFARGLGGQVGVTVGALGAPEGRQLGPLKSGVAWSSIKVALAARVLETKGGPGGLGPLADAMRRAITASDNAAADQLFDALGSDDASAAASATTVLRKAGDSQTTVSAKGRDGFSPYGQTEWTLTNQGRFMSRLAAGCVLDAPSTRYLVTLMGEVVPDQRWGLGTTGTTARFKGGWGPGSGGGYLVRQMGVIEVDGKQVVVTLAALPSDGQFASGTAMLSKLAGWVKDNVDARGSTRTAC